MTSPIVFALDFETLEEARTAAAEVGDAAGMMKIGLELFVRAGPPAVAAIRATGSPIFLDLKLHDIPETVERAVAQASSLGASVLTVHALGGRTMLRRAVERATREGGILHVCAVTILTSLDDKDLADVGIRGHDSSSSSSAAATSLASRKLARLAFDEGVRWFVCSASEVASLRDDLGPEAVLITPGIRRSSPDAAADDQKRVATAAEAIARGANWLVVGRPIRDARDRRAAALGFREEAQRGLRSQP